MRFGLTSPSSLRAARASLLTSLVLLGVPAGAPVGVEPTSDKEPPLSVRATRARDLLFALDQSAPARVESLNHAILSVETAGRVLELPVVVGTRVARGDLLGRLDCRDNELTERQQRAALEGAEARLDLSEKQVRRLRSLRGDRNVSEEQLNQAESELQSANAALKAARAAVSAAGLAVERCEVRAPFAGVVTARLAAEGSYLLPGSPLLQLLDSERLELVGELRLSQLQDLRGVTERQTPLQFVWQDQRFELELPRLVPLLDARGRSQQVRLVFVADSPLPGSAGRLEWRGAREYLPADLLVRRDGQLGVFVVEGENARFVSLSDAVEGQPARASSLSLDAQVVSEGRDALQSGDPVRLVDEREPDDPGE